MVGTGTVVQLPATTLDLDGAAYIVYAGRYFDAAEHIKHSVATSGFDPVPFQLYCLSTELLLKSFLWCSNSDIRSESLRREYGHDLVKLWRDSKKFGINRYARVTPLRDKVICLVGPYYKDRQFCYLDIDMVFCGYKKLRANPRALSTLRRLNLQLARSLEKPVLAAR